MQIMFLLGHARLGVYCCVRFLEDEILQFFRYTLDALIWRGKYEKSLMFFGGFRDFTGLQHMAILFQLLISFRNSGLSVKFLYKKV